jgi:hypothetical protein
LASHSIPQMLGNIYVKYFKEEDAERALQKLTDK